MRIEITSEGGVTVTNEEVPEESCWRVSRAALVALGAGLSEPDDDGEPPYMPPGQNLPVGIQQLHIPSFSVSPANLQTAPISIESEGVVAHPVLRARDRIRSVAGGEPPASARLYLTNQAADEVLVFDRRSGEIVSRVAVDPGPRGIAITPDGLHLYVASEEAGVVSVVETAALEVIQTIALPGGSAPAGVAITPDGRTVYVASAEETGRVFLIDTATRTVGESIRTGRQAVNVAVSPDGTLAYVTSTGDGRVHVIDVLTSTVIEAFVVPDAYGIAFHPFGSSVFVTSASAPGKVTMFEVGADRAAMEWTVGDMPLGAAVGLRGEALYVSNRDSGVITVISIPKQMVVDTIEVGEGLGPLILLPEV